MTVFVTGGTGKTGRRVVARLAERGVEVRAGSRRSAVPFDWADASTWAAALAGASLAYVAYAPDLAVPQAPRQIADFTRTALDAGVQRFVLLSGRGEPEAEEAEQALLTLAPASTVLRAAWLIQNFTEGAFAEPLRAGELALPVGPAVVEPFVDAADVAEAAVAVLTGTGHEGRVYELTGPRPLTFAEAVAEIGGSGFRSVPMAGFEAGLRAAGEPEEAIALLRYLFGTLFDGRNAAVGDGVRTLLGRAPRDIRERSFVN
ncbi:NAD-dependent epimerase/dehydratase family protein [Catenuloplanes indicus]|uniref:Uncharacterized protein YbjT (DUF2867 family) n=1 Tax=Catenuloplanes indicus TaxID=137267 RepID=A0AAE4AWZ2_9ACTN|nr:NAD-dependent epimerase/dehydratase family protein [Catenuloplanes indicus]MDQ0365584.1 uncharacterized protein YbjT (DUF2867 family) [Catenuloplanes indicus]